MPPIGSFAVRVRNGWLSAGEWTTVAKTFVLGVLVGGVAAVAILATAEGSGVTATDAAVVAGGIVAVLAWTRLPNATK